MLIHISKEVTLLCMDVLTTYLTPTRGGAYGNNGEIGLKTSRKCSKTAEKRPKTGIGKLVVCLGPGEFAGSNPVTSTMLSVHNASELWTLSFSIYSTYLIFVCRGAGSVSLLVFVRRSRCLEDIRPRRRDGY